MDDVIIVGGGPAGLAVGLYCSRAKLRTVILERLFPGGQAALTDFIENYPGFPEGISGPDLAAKMQAQAEKFGCTIRSEEVVKADLKGKTVETYAGTYSWKALIIATGADPRTLEVPGADKLVGRGISFCATCDGALFSGKTVAVVGGGDSAVKEAMFLTRFASRVLLVHRRDTLRAEKIVQEKAFENPRIEFILDSLVTGIVGEEKVESVKLKNVKTGEESILPVDGVFIYIGGVPNTLIFDVEKDASGYILTDEKMQTSVKGVFAAGDCRKKEQRQVATAVGDGVTAAMYVEEYLSNPVI